MSDRHAGYIVVLEKDCREDDSQHIIEAIKMIRGVIAVRPVVPDAITAIAEARVRRELLAKILDLLK